MVYDDVVDVVVESTHASAEARRGAIERLRSIDARGSTNLGEGWLRGCEQVAGHLVERGVNRCLLLTDGLANIGITDPEALASHAAELRARGVSTSTFGVGNDFDERLLQAIADAGGGHFYYIADAPQIRDAITSEVGETLEVVAREVDLEITARDDIRIEPISPYPARSRGNRTVVSLGDLGSEQVVEVVLRLSFPYGEIGRETGAIVALTDRDGVFGAGGAGETEPARLTWTYADDRANDGQPRDPRRRSSRRASLRRPSAAGGRPAQPQRRLRRRAGGSWTRPPSGSAATPGTTRSCAGSSTSSVRNRSPTPPRWPSPASSGHILRAPTCFAAATRPGDPSSAADGPRLFALRTA